MKLKTKLMMFTAAAALSANMAYAAINPQTLADAYLAEGYTYVEVKVGPTQTKLEGVKGDRKVEVIYDNASGQIIKQEFEDAGDDYVGRTGVEIEDTDRDFEDAGDENDDDENDGDEDDGDENDDAEDDGDDSDDGENDDDENEDETEDENGSADDENEDSGSDGDESDEGDSGEDQGDEDSGNESDENDGGSEGKED